MLSHDETPRKSAVGENANSDMLSSGGEESATSFEMSPVVLVVVLLAVLPPEKRDILIEVGPCPVLYVVKDEQAFYNCWREKLQLVKA